MTNSVASSVTRDIKRILKFTVVALGVSLAALALDSSRRYLIAAPAPKALSAKFDENAIKFELAAEDGSFLYPCRHTREDDFTQDWKVICGDGRPSTLRIYSVHLWLKTYLREIEPKATYEVMYWIKEHPKDMKLPARSLGSTIRLRAKDLSEISGLDLVQDVHDMDTASVLRAKIKL